LEVLSGGAWRKAAKPPCALLKKPLINSEYFYFYLEIYFCFAQKDLSVNERFF
jgi:hypothetical protein